MDAVSDGPLIGPAKHKKKSDISFLERRIKSLILRKQTTANTAEIRGDLGLNLLHEPPECLVEFIFVHGLRGGSRKTWSASPDPGYYWPKEWLRDDPDFRCVRIHSFGYNSDWLDRRENPLRIHDFGQSLLQDVYNNPSIKRNKNSRIVFIGHSMGGLVIKKACILSREDPAFNSLSARIHSIYFLATPHRGSDLAHTLNRILKAMPTGNKAFIGSLAPNSETLDSLNDQFRHACKGVTIHSFTESIPMGSGLVVDTKSATLGYPDEQIQAINANHRNICKFDSPNDPNFRTLRNKLASTVEDIERCVPKSMHQEYHGEMQTISRYLCLSSNPINDLPSDDTRVPGSCEWLTSGNQFMHWQFDEDSPRFFWLTGKPATGKSILAFHAIECLQENCCSHYFFKYGDQSRSSIGGLLRSIAYQMAQKNHVIRETLLKLSQDDPVLDKDDYRSIWRKVFNGGIFQTKFTSTQYWVIDALDECIAAEKRNINGFFTMLGKIDLAIPIKIFISSRPSVDLERLFTTLPFINVQISVEDSTQDIRMFVEANAYDLPAEDDESRKDLIERIIQKSSGCFLWTVLVMQQLCDAYVLEDIDVALDEVPEEMDQLYTRNLEIMESKPRTKNLAQTVLTWTLCATRPLSIEELKDAIQLDLKTTVARGLEKSISTLCSQFVFVDKHGRVHIVHDTARRFLLNDDLQSDFRVQLHLGNLRLALVCLTYLSSEDLSSRKRKGTAIAAREPDKNSLASYACLSFSDHIVRSPSKSDPLFLAITKFLRTNILSWIENMAKEKSLNSLMRSAKHLKAYQARRAKHMAPLQDAINAWATDLPRIVTEFGSNLLKHPSAIHDFIPPLCPKSSAIYRQFGALDTGLQLYGLANSEWDDRISCWHCSSTARSITCQDQWFAIGLSNGMINIHLTSTCQGIVHMDHGEPVRILRFGNLAKVVASTGLRMIKLWDVSTGSQLWEYKIDSHPLALGFEDDDQRLYVATRAKQTLILSTFNGAVIRGIDWHHSVPLNHHHAISRAPSAVAISTSHHLMAIIYRSMPLCLWNLESEQQIGFCTKTYDDGRDTSNNILSACFNPIQDLKMLAVAYWDGDVAIFDTVSRAMKCHAKVETQLLSVSPDGRTLAGGDSIGNVKLFDFETLQLLYSVTSSSDGIAALTFTSDNLRLMELRGNEVNVWEPSVLVRKWDFADEDQSEISSDAPIPLTQEPLEANSFDHARDITCMRAMFAGSMAICGRNNGSVDIYDLGSTEPTFKTLYKHKGGSMSILSLDWNEMHQIVASVDASSRLKALRLSKNPDNVITVVGELLDSQLSFGLLVNQLLISPDGTKLLVSCPSADFLWSLENKTLIGSQETASRTNWRWFTHLQKPSQLVHLEDTKMRFFSWETLEFFQQIGGDSLVDMEQAQTLDLSTIVLDTIGNTVIINLSFQENGESFTSSRNANRAVLCNLEVSRHQGSEIKILHPVLFFRSESHKDLLTASAILGTTAGAFGRRMLVFISTSGWVCSVYLDEPLPHISIQRHFFIPSAWLTTGANIISLVTERKDILFVRGHEVAIINGGLEAGEVISLR